MIAVVLAAGACRPGSVPLPRVAEETHQEAHPEPKLPTMLTVTPDTQDSEVFVVRVTPAMTGVGRLSVRADRPFAWEQNNAGGPMLMRRGELPKVAQLRVPRRGGEENDDAGVVVNLTIENEAGNVLMTVSEEVPVAGEKAGEPALSNEFTATDAKGHPIIVSVPVNAPMPVVAEERP